MMGPHHAACGAAAWLAVTTRFHIDLTGAAHTLAFLPPGIDVGLGLLPVSASGVLAGTIVTAGAALLPDADHRHATIAHSLPPLSNAMCIEVGRLSGGHRHGTHSVLGMAVFVGIALLAGMWTAQLAPFGTIYPGAGILSVLLGAFAAKALKFIPDTMRKFPWILGLALGAFITFFAPQEQFWFPLAVALGVAVHIAGDMLTTGGCNLMWPLSLRPPKFARKIPLVRNVWKRNGSVAIPVLGNAGSYREWMLLVPVSAYAVFGIVGTTARWFS
ncbi:hydrolase [Arthrobacter sp. ERGS1:01]|uniref:metal-dependent hydrolase n=1 Tax=Arthrobacter sp. ERGS1:01 TaxID=1704044 RepID=UPI0006B44849|nr:metal-dependent hydrolase [Arthrobacter sp. ERGS1:01]ALE07393.1 hydrolase [Arthrobacter sp. ERGS1:01]